MKVDLDKDFVTWRVDGTIKDWIETLPISAASVIDAYCADAPNALTEASLSIAANIVSTWSESAARALALPGNCPLGFDLRLSGAMGRPGAEINVRWLEPGRTIGARGSEANGLWISHNKKTYRIQAPLYEVLGLAEEFNSKQGAQLEEQFRLWSRIRECLGDDRATDLTDGFLRSFRVMSASAFTLSLDIDARGDVQLAPLLLAKQSNEGLDADQLVQVLTPAEATRLPDLLDRMRDGASAFPLGEGSYVVVDEPLQKALVAVKRLRQASPEVRMRAAMQPEALIRELLDHGESEPSVFIETERYSERVRDVGVWSEPILPWIKIAPMKWGAPPSMGIKLGDTEIPLEEESVRQILAAMKVAQSNGTPSTEIGGHPIPATAQNIAALERLVKAWDRQSKGLAPNDEAQARADNVLVIETNLEQHTFTPSRNNGRAGKVELPLGLKTSPKHHQEIGITWLQRHWIEGSRGAMLCDDMGLGKTYQGLAFFLWLRELMEAGQMERRPLLIVAPVGLLRNWEAETQYHLRSPGLGDFVRAYGEHTRALHRGRHMDGNASLDTTRLGSADVILTNYETVSTYQLSFGAIRFSAVLLDEAQKIKSPKARMTNAIKALNSEFVLALTGTPVENRLADLWCISDAVQPGCLGTLKDFSSRFEADGADVSGLRSTVWQEEKDAPAGAPKLILRRMKTDKLEGLPEKFEHMMSETMPARQLAAYERSLLIGQTGGAGSALEMIQALRRVSLHPDLIEGSDDSGELKIEESARFLSMLRVLDRIALTREKALVFVDALHLHQADQLPTLLQRRYGLARSPMVIHGSIQTDQRQQRVDKFQSEQGFDVMLLSPKAAGVGLTLTAANHVIHLSRWWNPAVEDQCSDRVYRIGQTKPVHIYYPVALLPGDLSDCSFDMRLHELMGRKRQLAGNLLAAPTFTADEMQQLASSTLQGLKT
jgi:hypothetical protein